MYCFGKILKWVSVKQLLVFLCSTIIMGTVLAQAIIEEVVVTARKRTENLQDVPIAVTAFQGADLEQRDLFDISQISNLTPNVTLRPTASLSGSSNSSAFFIRGIGQTDFAVTTDPGVGTYIDGVYIARSVGGVLETLDVESVEILRGPQGTLFGRNTIGGAVNVRTKRPGDEPGGDFRLTVGRFDRIDVAGAVDLPVNDQLKLRVSGLTQNRDGFVRRLVTDSVLQTDDNIVGNRQGNENSDTVRGSILFNATDDLEFLVNVEQTRVREESAASTAAITSAGLAGPTLLTPVVTQDFGLVVPGDARFITDDIDTTFATGPNETTLDIFGVTGTVTWNLNDLEFKSITSYRETDGTFNRDGDGTPFPIGEQTRTIDFEQFTQELQVNGSGFDARLDWTAGIFYFTEEATDRVLVRLGNILPPPGIDIDNLIDNESFAVFAQGTFDLIDKLSLTGGIRWTRDEKEYATAQIIAGVPVTVVDGSNSAEFDAVTGSAGLEYRWNEELLTYFSAARGFKSGGFTPRYVAPVAAPLPFDQETVWSYEIGAKWQGLEDRARLNLAAFYTDYTDIQLVLFDNFGAPINQNGGKATILGIEAEGTYIFNDYFSLSATLGYTDAEFDEVLPPLLVPFQPITVDSRFPNTPEFQSSVSPRLAFPLATGEIRLGLDWFYSSGIHQTFENDPELFQDSHHLLDASIAYADLRGGWSLTLGVHNAANERIMISGGIGRVPGFGDRNFNRPREWYLSLSKSF